MAILRAQIELLMSDEAQETAPTNVLWFDSTAPETDAEEIRVAIGEAYVAFQGRLSGQVEVGVHRVRIYDMADPMPRAPILDGGFNLSSAPTGNSLPPQCALTVSFQGVRVSGVPQARRRGRAYLGPLHTGVTGAEGHATGTTVLAGVSWAQALLTASLDATTWNWVVWSRVNEQAVVITNGWVDDSIDTQRRRSNDANVRTPWEAAP